MRASFALYNSNFILTITSNASKKVKLPSDKFELDSLFTVNPTENTGNMGNRENMESIIECQPKLRNSATSPILIISKQN